MLLAGLASLGHKELETSKHRQVCSTVHRIEQLWIDAIDKFSFSMKTLTMEPGNNDEKWMAEALAEAASAQSEGEVPVGAVIVKNGKIIARGQNRNLRDNDPTAHAEIVAMRGAGERLRNHRLEGCEMFVTIEPCAMCAGAMVHARLQRLVYGAKDPKAGAVESVIPVLNHPRLNHRVQVTSGVLEDRCSAVVRSFFRSKRATGEGTVT